MKKIVLVVLMVLCANGDSVGGGSASYQGGEFNACKENKKQECLSENCSGAVNAACVSKCLNKAMQECKM